MFSHEYITMRKNICFEIFFQYFLFTKQMKQYCFDSIVEIPRLQIFVSALLAFTKAVIWICCSFMKWSYQGKSDFLRFDVSWMKFKQKKSELKHLKEMSKSRFSVYVELALFWLIQLFYNFLHNNLKMIKNNFSTAFL